MPICSRRGRRSSDGARHNRRMPPKDERAHLICDQAGARWTVRGRAGGRSPPAGHKYGRSQKTRFFLGSSCALFFPAALLLLNGSHGYYSRASMIDP
uniref:Uncharacterized protein n=1 Tax=Plectus sambesii TaxID=2011161 RepID=A0A914VG95_9BILA